MTMGYVRFANHFGSFKHAAIMPGHFLRPPMFYRWIQRCSFTIAPSPTAAIRMVALDQNLKRPNADIKETAPARREKRAPVQQMKFGDETDLLNDSIPIIEKLY